MRKLVALLVLFLFVSMTQPVCANADVAGNAREENLYYAYQVAEIFIQGICKEALIEKYVLLENIYGEEEAVLFSIKGAGYIIVDMKDLSIPEVSFEGENPYKGYQNPVYNGPLNYLIRIGDEYMRIYDNKMMSVTEFNSIYVKENMENKEEYINSLKKRSIKKARPLYEDGYLKRPLVTWTETGECCGAIAAAICLKYYRDNVDYRYVESQYNNSASLIELMRNEISASFSSLELVVNGLNHYLRRYHPDTEVIGRESFNFLLLKARIRAERPVMLGYVKEIYYGEKLYHWVIAHGFVDAGGNGNYAVVNDGLGRNNIWLLLEETEMKYMVYFNK